MHYQFISQYFGINKQRLGEIGVFDRFIGIDTQLFVDPFLLDTLNIPEFIGSRDKIKDRFRKVIKLLSISKSQNDIAFKGAVKLLIFKEVKGVGIGYGKNTGDGNCIGLKLAIKLAETGKEIVDLGINDPEIFELLGLFQEGYGADRLSDLTINILHQEFINYTLRISKELGIKQLRKKYKGKESRFPFIEKTGECILFLPQKLLRELPTANDRDNIDHVVSFNNELRNKLNQLIGDDWAKFMKSKINRKKLFFDNKNALMQLVNYYKTKNPTHYDFTEDPKGEIKWKTIGEEIANSNPLKLVLPTEPQISDVEIVIESIIKQFKKNVEFNGVNKLLIKSNGRYSEEFCQKVFYVVADSYCHANDLDLTAESDGGRGPVDFKISKGLKKVVVEIKLTSNTNFIHGIKTQLPIYQNSEMAKGIFLVIQVNEAKSKLNNLSRLEIESKKQRLPFPKYFIVDARLKPSASKVR